MPKVIDLDAGAGGLSLGAARAGFDLAAAVELDPQAMETHSKNFPNSVHLQTDISQLDGKTLLQLSGLEFGELSGLIGGPPCQGFSIMGKRDLSDARNRLFIQFFSLVAETKPAFFLAENVPGIITPCYDSLREQAFNLVREKYYILPPLTVKANHYGAPTTRTRIFFIGYDPKRVSDLSAADFKPVSNIAETRVHEGLRGLPEAIDSHWILEEQGWHFVDDAGNGYFADRIKGYVPYGVGDPHSLERYFKNHEISGCLGTRHTKEVEERYQKLLPGQQDVVSKSIKLDPLGFCPTIRAGTDSKNGSYQSVRPISYKQPRVITPREAARLQGFPDWFVFHKTKWHSFRQIGNSVCPLVSEALLRVIFNKLYY